MTNFAILFNIFIFDKDAKVDISLWGYRETSIEPELVCALLLSFKLYFFLFKKIIFVSKKVYIAQLGASETNDGRLQILPADFADHDDGPKARSCRWMAMITTMMMMMVAVKMKVIMITMEDEGGDLGGLLICHKEYADVCNQIYPKNNR